MGMKEDVLVLADDVEATVEGCSACVVLADGACNADSDYDCQDAICEAIAKRLRAIAEKDAESVTTVSAYDLLPDEDRKAIAWVREQGGLDEVEKRLMPEGMEWLLDVWPKWDNGEYCRFGDWWTAENYGEGRPRQLSKLSIYTPEYLAGLGRGNGESYGYAWDFFRSRDVEYHPVKVEPPAPKVFDADGVEIRVGDTVWRVGNGVEFTVIGLPRSGEYQAVKLRLDDGAVTGLDPDQLTHERPESWERLEEDAVKGSCDYFGYDANGCDGCPAYSWNTARGGKGCGNAKTADIVRRARKLAERGA